MCGKLSLYEAICLLKTEEEVERFWMDLLTPKERKMIMNRWRAFCLMCIESPSQRQAREQLGVSLDTVNTASQVLVKGTGEMRRVIQTLRQERKQSRHENNDRK